MINNFTIDDSPMELKSDIGGEYPIYIYISEDKSTLWYSINLTKLLNHEKILRNLKINYEGVSFLLQSSIIPPPKSIFNNLYILGIGDTACIKVINKKIRVEFIKKFPFMNSYRKKEVNIDKDNILHMLYKSVVNRVDNKKPSFLFHSAGKDSNTIALSLAKHDYKDNVTCISHKSIDERDESEISKKISETLGFKHQILYEPSSINSSHLKAIDYYFINQPFPCLDAISLAHPIYSTQIDFQDHNVIDGMGNDVYIGHVPSKREYYGQKYFWPLHNLRPFFSELSSKSILALLLRTRCEWTGLSGFSFWDTKKIFPMAFNVYDFWEKEEIKISQFDYFDLRGLVRGTMIDTEMFIRKIRNFSDVYNANLILPFCDKQVCTYFSELPSKYLFDKSQFKNKLILRDILMEEIGLDSNKLGKLSYTFNFYHVLKEMKLIVHEEIVTCKLWDSKEIKLFLSRLYYQIENNKIMSNRLKTKLLRLYLLSAWFNKNKYVNTKNEH